MRQIRSIPLWEYLRLWAANEREQFGLLLAFGLGLLLCVFFGLLKLPIGPAVMTRGRVVDAEARGGRHGDVTGATVTVEGRTFWLYLDPSYDCRTGDDILLDRRRTAWGVRYQEPYIPRPCSRPHIEPADPFSQQ